jgi:hypothetical protein
MTSDDEWTERDNIIILATMECMLVEAVRLARFIAEDSRASLVCSVKDSMDVFAKTLEREGSAITSRVAAALQKRTAKNDASAA